MRCSAADSHLKLLDRVVRSAGFLAGLVLECNLVHRPLLLLLLLLKKVSSARLAESDMHPISPKTSAPQYQPIDRKKRKGKRVEDYSRNRAA